MNAIDMLLKIDKGEIKVPTHVEKMFLKKLGKEVEFECRAVDPAKATKINSNALDMEDGNVEGVDLFRMRVDMITAGCALFRSKEILEHFKVPTSEDLIKLLMLDGEIIHLYDAIVGLSAFKKVKDEDIKN